jgi:hypothetical protein
MKNEEGRMGRDFSLPVFWLRALPPFGGKAEEAD